MVMYTIPGYLEYIYIYTHVYVIYYNYCMLGSTAIALLRKYYDTMLEYFPDDHITTIGLLSGMVRLRGGFFEEVITCTDPRDANQRILNAIFLKMEHDGQFAIACELIKALIGSKQHSKEFVEFETGKYENYGLINKTWCYV